MFSWAVIDCKRLLCCTLYFHLYFCAHCILKSFWSALFFINIEIFVFLSQMLFEYRENGRVKRLSDKRFKASTALKKSKQCCEDHYGFK